MKNEVRFIRLKNCSWVLVMLLSVLPLAGYAQADDIYFVPKKESEKKVLVVESISEKYGIGNETKNYTRNVDEYNRRSGGFTNDPEAYIEENYSDEYVSDGEEYQEYDYSTRIIRFHSPRSAFSSIYWDLSYGCGINDWYVYDNGYSIDIYPTANNPLYYWSGYPYAWRSINYYNWVSMYNWYSWNYTPYWNWGWNIHGYCYPGYHYSHNPYWHGHNWYAHHWNSNWNSNWYAGRTPNRRIPHNGAVTAKGDNTRGRIPSNSSVRGGDNRGVTSNRNGGAVDLRGVRTPADKNGNAATVQRNDREVNNKRQGVDLRGNKVGNEGNGNSSVRTREIGSGSRNNAGRQDGQSGIRRQQPARTMVNGNSNQRNNTESRSTNGNVRQNRNEGNGSARGEQNGNVSRRSSSSSGSYNRQSSTNVTRQRTGSTQSRASSNSGSNYRSGSSNRSSGSSYGSGSSSRSSGSSFGSGSSSRSSSSSFGGGSSSRSSSGGASRSSGGSRGR